jgi:hypothetical protein
MNHGFLVPGSRFKIKRIEGHTFILGHRFIFGNPDSSAADPECVLPHLKAIEEKAKSTKSVAL